MSALPSAFDVSLPAALDARYRRPGGRQHRYLFAGRCQRQCLANLHPGRRQYSDLVRSGQHRCGPRRQNRSIRPAADRADQQRRHGFHQFLGRGRRQRDSNHPDRSKRGPGQRRPGRAGGTVNAGDAGIGAAGNINIAARTVVGLSNIQFGGTSTGVPAQISNAGASLGRLGRGEQCDQYLDRRGDQQYRRTGRGGAAFAGRGLVARRLCDRARRGELQARRHRVLEAAKDPGAIRDCHSGVMRGAEDTRL